MLTDEPFGLREIDGALLIIVAGIAEVLKRKSGQTAGVEVPSTTGS